jgi:hypothetical protein
VAGHDPADGVGRHGGGGPLGGAEPVPDPVLVPSVPHQHPELPDLAAADAGRRAVGDTVDPWFQIPSYKFWFLYLFPPVRTLEFVLGVILVYIVRTKQWPRLPFSVAALLVVASYVGEIYVSIPYAFVAMTVASLALLIPAAATADVRGTFSPVRGRVAVFLGEISSATPGSTARPCPVRRHSVASAASAPSSSGSAPSCVPPHPQRALRPAADQELVPPRATALGVVLAVVSGGGDRRHVRPAVLDNRAR